MRHRTHNSAYEYSVGVAFGHEFLRVPTPRPTAVPVTAGHWRVDRKVKQQPKPRLICRPTGGGPEQRNVNPGPRKQRKVAVAKQPTARSLHGAWAKGTLEF